MCFPGWSPSHPSLVLPLPPGRDPNLVSVAAFFGDDLKVNFCGKLALDPSPQVRLVLVQVLGDWMLNLGERMDHEHRLLPYLLGALSDGDAGVQVRCLERRAGWRAGG